MAKIRRAVYIMTQWSIITVLAVMPAIFMLHENIFRQLPLYCFLEKQLLYDEQGQDWETYEKLMESNAKYLGQKVAEENQFERDKQETIAASPVLIATPTPLPVTPTIEVTQIPAEKQGEEEAETAAAQVQPMPEIDLKPETLADYNYLMNHFFILDSGTEITAAQLNAASLLSEDLTIPKETENPQILIYHSHSQEAFVDSREGKTEDTIVGVGDYLADILKEKYQYQVMHVTEEFDMAGGELDRSGAYDYARNWLEPVLEENPSIQVLIDLHRDGVPEDRRLVTEINGKPTAQIMFYNGLSHTVKSGDLSYLPNPYIQDNLAFSFQLEYQAALYYPNLYRGIYLAGLRYNLHLRPRALLLEAGAQTNTVEEVKNAMEPFAEILDRVLQGNS